MGAVDGFRGHHRERRSRAPIGPVAQRDLVVILRKLIDVSRGKSSSRTRDEARRMLRLLMAEANWNTPYILRNIGAKRCRYLSGMGYTIDAAYSMRSSIERLEQWVDRNG